MLAAPDRRFYNPAMDFRAVPPSTSVVIPNYNGAELLEACLTSLGQQTYRDFEILVVDNASRDASLEVAQKRAPDARVLRQRKNLGFAAAVNAGVRSARGVWVAILNNDTEAAVTWLEELHLAAGRHPEADFFASRILDIHDRGRIYSAGDCFLRIGVGYRRGQDLPDAAGYREEIEIFSASGCAAFIRKSAWDMLGGFDERFFAYLEDVDLGLRMQATGLEGYYVPGAVVYHHGGGTSGGEFSPLSVRLRTRNSILLLIKNLPLRVLARCLLPILASQAAWLARVIAHRRLGSYLRGIFEVLPHLPPMLSQRAALRDAWRRAPGRLWERILRSEALARRDYETCGSRTPSQFLSWYFGRFR